RTPPRHLRDSVPPPLFTAAGVSATTNPPGRLSVNATPFSATVLELLSVKVFPVLPFSEIVAAPKALLIVGAASTVTVAVLLVVPVPTLAELTAPVVLFLAPAVVPFTVT